MLNATQLTALARQIAKTGGYTWQAGALLNTILADLCQVYDLDAARKAFNFLLTPASTRIGNLNAQLASGPFTLPADYLRTKFGDVLFFPNGLASSGAPFGIAGFPLKLMPIDINEFDALVQQAGFQNFPVFWVTDMSTAAPVLTVQGAVTQGSPNLTIPGSLATPGLANGLGVYGPGIPQGAQTAGSSAGATTVVSFSGGSGPDTVVVMSAAAIATVASAAYSFAVCPIAYVWPPASGSYPMLVRYYSQMSDILSPEQSTVVPWFPNQEYLRKKLAASLMELSGDDRHAAHAVEAANDLRLYLTMKDDSSNRAQRVHLDPRRFGPEWNRLPKSKVFGYLWLSCFAISSLIAGMTAGGF